MAKTLQQLATGFPSGTVFADRYRLIGVLGRGRSHTVYLCRDRERQNSRVAVKVLNQDLADSSEAKLEFIREYLLGASVKNQFVLEYFETVRDKRIHAFAAEFVPGGTLASLIARCSFPEIKDSVRLLGEILQGLSALHGANVVHHDLKPANILLTARRSPKISDFGISRLHGQCFDSEEFNRRGTPFYMAPEYLLEGHASPLSDIYSAGILAYELVCGQLPFAGSTLMETLDLRFKIKPEPPHSVRPDCPVRVSRVILKAMALDPMERFQSADEMFDAFRHSWVPLWLPVSALRNRSRVA